MITFLNALLLAVLGPLFVLPLLVRKPTPAKISIRAGEPK